MSDPLSRIRSAVAPARRAATLLRNRATASGFGERARRHGEIPGAAVALYFATGPENLYQFEQWRRPLEHLAPTRPVVLITDRPDTGERLLASTSLPVAFARRSGELERLVAEHDIRVVLYANQVDQNFRMLRFAGPVHIQIGHGESDKGSSVSNQHKAYDLVFVGGEAGRQRLGQALRDYDADRRTIAVGRPQLDYDYPGAPDWPADSGFRVWYAPTWEGDRASIAYGSLASHGVALVEALIADPSVRLIYRPHPRTGTASAAHAAADRAIRRLLVGSERHLIDTGGYGWQWRFADACVTDISAVAYDWLATGKPLVITEPTAGAYRPPSALLDEWPLLPAGEAGGVLTRLRAQQSDPAVARRLSELVSRYFGDTSPGASTARFEAAIQRAYALQAAG